MAQADAATRPVERLDELVDGLERQEGFAEVVESLASGHAATLDGAWGSSCALAAAALARHVPATLVVVTPTVEAVDELLDELPLFTSRRAIRLPTLEAATSTDDAAMSGERLRALKALAGAEPPELLIASIASLLQPCPSADVLRAQTRVLRVGEVLLADELGQWLVESGFHATTAVELPGEFSVRGGIVDVFAPDWSDPVRIELFGDEIESLRQFEVATQRSLSVLRQVDLTVLRPSAADRTPATDYVPAGSWYLLLEPGDLEQQARHFLGRVEGEPPLTYADVMREMVRRPSVAASAVAAGSLETTCHLRIESVERFSGDIHRVRDELEEAGAGQQVIIVCQAEGETQRLAEVFASTRLVAQGRLRFAIGTLHQGFRLVNLGTVVLSSGELFRRHDLQRPSRRRLGRAIDSFLELRPGDLVVHVAHGIARYRGLELLEKEGQAEEHLVLEFQGQTKLYVPSSKIGLVQKYVGGARGRPMLARLGGKLWERQKSRVKEAVADMAADMLELQASRASHPGIAFPPDTAWQTEFDASFPYRETEDQLHSIRAIKEDMLRPRPMDRLLCGDVGYGKTEVAMRAAFKAVDAGYQVAVLVPTTVLAEQHHRTFSERMAEFPFEIAALSRFATKGQQRRILERLAEGTVDIVIGTHRLAQPDVRFQNLGLVIIDEEQRFGVEVKERLKALRRIVDVLTMTATPIPRTLHMSLLGIRDISNLETPPEDRLAVETRVARFHPEMIRHAVLRELNRGGQVFCVHNRVHDIEVLATRLRQIVPEASLAIAHGQMAEHDLERVMVEFVNHRYDILLATTIIESGLDIPNANTIFIDEADRYGLADLHQLRGRVGRYKHRAYCYLLIDPNKSLTPSAAKRLRAIEEFSDMGAGFAIAMRDLEIRGAGNILGTEQSGHIATVGYELYCALLEQAVRRLKRMPPRETIEIDVDLPVHAFIPRSYVPDMRMKIDLYRRLARVATRGEVEDFRAELLDRFGPPPAPVEKLLDVAHLRVAAGHWLVTSIHREDSYLVLNYASGSRVRDLAAQCGGRLRIVDGRSAYLPLDPESRSPEGMLRVAKALLQES